MTTDLSGFSQIFSDITKPFVLGFPRVSAMLIVFPLLPSSLFPLALRNGIAIALLMPAYPLLRAALPDAPETPLLWLLFIAKESAIGAAIGWGFGVIIWAMEMVGGLLDIQTGTSSGATFDPLSQQPAAVYSQLMRNIAIIIFLGVGGFLALTRMFYESLRVWPTQANFPLNPEMVWDMARTSSTQMLSTILAIVLPFIVLLLIIELGLGLLNRTLPQLNVFSLSMPIKMLAAVLILALALGYLSDLVMQFVSGLNGLSALSK
jgi:type III secretion protein T